MKKILLLLVVCFAFTQGIAIAEDSGIRFHDLFGQVTVRPDDEDDDLYEYAQLDTVLNYNDRIRTDVKSGAVLNFKDMSTFVIKDKTILVLPRPEGQTSTMKVVAGNVWMNMKKMVDGGEFNIELTQAVAGIKGTVLSCSSNPDQDRIVCARGRVRVKNRHTGEETDLEPGEEIRITSRGGSKKGKANLQQFERDWKKELENLGSSLNNSELIEECNSRMVIIRELKAEVQEYFDGLLKLETVEDSSITRLRKNITALTGETMEAGYLHASVQKRMKEDKEAAVELKFVAFELAALISEINVYTSRLQGEMEQLKSASAAMQSDKDVEIANLENELQSEYNYWDNLRKELGEAHGKTQSWFETTQSEATLRLEALSRLGEDMDRLQEGSTSPVLRSMSIRYKNYVTSTAKILRDLRVSIIDLGTIEILEDCEKNIADNIIIFNDEWAKYKNIDRQNLNAQSRVLTQSLRIISSFGKIRRQYDRANRLQLSVLRNASTQVFKTAELIEVEELWIRIFDQFARLSDVSDILQRSIDDLQRQINSNKNMGR
jgi:hypothetical protein